MAYRRRTTARKGRRSYARAPARRSRGSYSSRRKPARSKRRVRGGSRAPAQVVRIELVQSPQAMSANPIADAMAAQKKETPPPKKARF